MKTITLSFTEDQVRNIVANSVIFQDILYAKLFNESVENPYENVVLKDRFGAIVLTPKSFCDKVATLGRTRKIQAIKDVREDFCTWEPNSLGLRCRVSIISLKDAKDFVEAVVAIKYPQN